MHHPALVLSLHEQGPELVHGPRMLHARPTAQFPYRQASLPYDIVYGQFVCIYGHLAVLHVDKGRKTRKIKAEEIQERRILTKRIGIARIIHTGLVIAKEQQKPGLVEPPHLFHESGSPFYISLFCKHG